MSTDKIEPSKTETVSSTELTDEQLNEVTGGGKNTSSDQPVKYMEFKLKEVLISGVQSGGS
jgi:bacteriocin-like protein